MKKTVPFYKTRPLPPPPTFIKTIHAFEGPIFYYKDTDGWPVQTLIPVIYIESTLDELFILPNATRIEVVKNQITVKHSYDVIQMLEIKRIMSVKGWLSKKEKTIWKRITPENLNHYIKTGELHTIPYYNDHTTDDIKQIYQYDTRKYYQSLLTVNMYRWTHKEKSDDVDECESIS